MHRYIRMGYRHNQEVSVSPIMGEEIPYHAIMDSIALPGTAYQELCARGIHHLQKENAVTGSGSMEGAEKSCRSCPIIVPSDCIQGMDH